MKRDSRHGPEFSVLLPTHNRPDLLPFAIRSVLNQTVKDFELLVVGDGCTDHTSEVVTGFADPRIRWFDLPKAPNFGYANRNIALRAAGGAYIAFMAHDDLWLPDHLELLRPFLERDGVELAYSRPLWVIPLGLIAPGAFNLEHRPTLELFLSKQWNGIPAACVVHRRECFAKYGYWNEALPNCGDWDMWARIIEGGGRNNFAYLTEPTCLHFRASWHTDAYLVWHKLSIWKQLHAHEGLLPTELKIAVEDGVPEQEAVWREIAAHPQEWTRQVRSAIRQTLDQRVLQANELTEALLTLRDQLGAVTALKRLEKPAAPLAAAANGSAPTASVDPKLYDAYVGEYEVTPTFKTTVFKEGEKLMTQATGQSAFELFPESTDKFFLKVVEAKVTFTRDDKGQVTGLVIHQRGHDAPARKTK